MSAEAAETRPARDLTQDDALAQVLALVHELAAELHGARAPHAAHAHASLEREIGLGSLERVELVARLERRFGRTLGDHLVSLDTPAELAAALLASHAAAPLHVPAQAPALAQAEPLHLQATTVHAALWQRAERDPRRPQVFLREDDGREQTVTYGELLHAARGVAGGLRERGVRRGARVALMLPTSLDFLRAFQGILVAGAIPVPIYPPVRIDRIEEYALRQSAILRDAGAVLMITVARARPVASLLRSAVPTLNAVVTVDELLEVGAHWPTLDGEGSEPAFIQYTSGSTGQPKGVLLTHDNLLANVRAIAAGLEARPSDVGASWLPLYHDMGLIGSWLFCLVQGFPIDIQSPLSFLARPERWLWAIHRRRATLSAAPNFAYELCVRRISDAALEGLDLSSWRCALNGAEPVSPLTMERFAQRFARYGFRREALLPVYGLAENAVALCFPPVLRGLRLDHVRRAAFEGARLAEAAPAQDASALRFVSVGRALPEHELRILDDNGQELPERHVGRLVFRGPSMTPGYFEQPQATAAMSVPGGFYDSGDLAYMADGEVYITGRRKDLIIKGGRNLVPQEIEEAAARVEGVRKGCVVALGVAQEQQGTELVVVVAETRATQAAQRERIERAVVESVAEAVGTPPDVVALVPPGAIPKTSSGKVRRAETKDLYRRGALGAHARNSLGTNLRLGLAAAGTHLRALARRVLRGGYALWLALALGGGLLVLWLLLRLLPGRRVAQVLQRWGARYALAVMGARPRLVGLAPSVAAQPLLLAANHTSYFDVLVLLAALPMDFVVVAKREAARYPFVGLFLRRAGHLAVERHEAQESVAGAQQVTDAVRSGRSVLVFPEGTFTAATGLRPFRLGIFKTAVEAGLPVTPVALRGVRALLRDGTWLPRPGPVEVWVGAPIAAQGEGWHAVVALRDRVADTLAEQCGEPRLDLLAAGPERRGTA